MDTKEEQVEELLSLGLNLDDLKSILAEKQSLGLIVFGQFKQLILLRRAVSDLGLTLIYNTFSPDKLYISRRPPMPDKEAEA